MRSILVLCSFALPPSPPQTHLVLCRNVASTGMVGCEVLGTGGVEREKKGIVWGRWLPLHSLDIVPAHPRWSFFLMPYTSSILFFPPLGIQK